jgi:hypothetical protein
MAQVREVRHRHIYCCARCKFVDHEIYADFPKRNLDFVVLLFGHSLGLGLIQTLEVSGILICILTNFFPFNFLTQMQIHTTDQVKMNRLNNILGEAYNISYPGDAALDEISVGSEDLSRRSSVHKAAKTSSLNITKSKKKLSDKPKRPLSAYNIFFQHEREKIVTSNPDVDLAEVLMKMKTKPKPARRRHRKSHGKISFADLARTIADKWKALSEGERHIYLSLAAVEKKKYREEVNDWTRAREGKKREDETFGIGPILFSDEDLRLSPVPIREGNEKGLAVKSGQPTNEALATLHHGGGGNYVNPLTFMGHSVGGIREYLALTQNTMELTTSTLSLPLFSNLQANQMFGANVAEEMGPAQKEIMGSSFPLWDLRHPGQLLTNTNPIENDDKRDSRLANNDQLQNFSRHF